MNYNIDTVDGLAKYAKNIASAVLDGKLYDSNAVLAICSMLHCNEDYAAECLDTWIETEQIHRSHKQEGSLFKKILNEAKSLNFSMESLALALEDIMPFAHPKCKLIKVFGKKQILTNYMPCFDYFGNDPYNPKSDTDNSFMVSLYHGAHQRLYIFNDDEMTEWNIEIDNKSVATVGYNDVNTLAHTIKELLYKNWPEQMKEAEYFVERKWEEGKRHAQEYIDMIDRSLASCNNSWSEYGRKNAGNDADWFVNKVKKNYAGAEKVISLCDKFMPTIRFTENKRMKENKSITPYDSLEKVKDASYDLPDGMKDIYWRIDSLWDDFTYTNREQNFKSWAEYNDYDEHHVEVWREYLTELYEDDIPESLNTAIDEVLTLIDAAQKAAGEAAAKASKVSQTSYERAIAVTKAINAAKIDGVVDAFVYTEKNILVDLDTDDEDEANEIANTIEFDILKNGRKHGRDDLQGMGQWHINVGTCADFSEDGYDDLDPDVRDMYQIIIEPAESYKTRRQYDW